MPPTLVAAVVLLALAALYAILVLQVNRRLAPRRFDRRPAAISALPSSLPARLTVTTWNIGYAGLGASSDFIADGGTSLLPPSAQAVEANLSQITNTIANDRADVLLLQEVASSGMMTRWVAVRQAIARQLVGRQTFFRPDVASWGIPWPLRTSHGTILALKANPSSAAVEPLPGEPGLLAGYLRRRYALQIVRVPIAGKASQWAIANLHLSAFDDGGKTRRAQVQAALQFAASEYAKGNHVVLGGDWNMVLSDPKWPSTTVVKYLFWIFDFPRQELADGWSIAVDPTTPTVRTLYQPYVPGENFVTSVDGFLVSPNVRVESTTTLDNGFSCSDHMPQTAVLVAL